MFCVCIEYYAFCFCMRPFGDTLSCWRDVLCVSMTLRTVFFWSIQAHRGVSIGKLVPGELPKWPTSPGLAGSSPAGRRGVGRLHRGSRNWVRWTSPLWGVRRCAGSPVLPTRYSWAHFYTWGPELEQSCWKGMEVRVKGLLLAGLHGCEDTNELWSRL